MAFNWIGFAVQIAVAFFLTPFVIHKLGDVRYGVWALTVSLTGYYGLLDLGFRAGLTQYVTRSLAVGDLNGANRVISSGLVALTSCAVIVGCLSLGCAYFAPAFLDVPLEIVPELFWCVIIIGAGLASQFLLFPFSAVLTAKHRFDISTIIGVGVRLLTAGATFLALEKDGGLIALSLITASGNLLDYFLRAVAAFRILPGLKGSFRLADKVTCRTLFGFGFWSMVSLASSRLVSYSDALVVGFFMPIAAVAWFALASTLVNYFSNVFIPVGQAFFPVAAELDAQRDFAGLRNAYLRTTGLLTVLSAVASLIAASFANDFYRLWIGAEFTEWNEFQPVPLLFQLLLIGAFSSVTQRIGCQVLIAAGRLRLLAAMTALEGLVNLALSIALVSKFGLVGVALGTAIPAVFFQLVLAPAVLHRHLHFDFRLYMRDVLWRTVVASALVCVPLYLYSHFWRIDDWFDLLVGGLSCAAAAIPIIWFAGISNTERRTLRELIRARLVGRPNEIEIETESKCESENRDVPATARLPESRCATK